MRPFGGKFSRVHALGIGAVMLFLMGAVAGNAGEYYQWTDREGNVHFSDSIGNIPSEYRNQVKTGMFEDEEPASEKTESSPSPRLETRESIRPDPDPSPKQYEVPYRAYEGTAKRIIVTAVLNESVTAPMAVDTGAPGILITYSLAEKLGIFSRNEGTLLVNAGGLGGTVPAVRAILDSIRIGEAKDTFIPVTITPPLTPAFEGLIGMDFMSRYQLRIDTRRHVMIFQEQPPDPAMPGGHDEEWWRDVFREFAYYKNEWKAYRDALDGNLGNTSGLTLSSIDEIKDLREFADGQYREADKLFNRLNGYAARHAVPMEWRQY